MEEEIICFRRELLTKRPNESGVFYDEVLWHNIVDNLQVIPRSSAERDYDFKQLVVYTVIKSKSLFLTYRRTPKTNEERLRNRYSIGVGGHINIGDRTQLTLFNSDHREGFLLEALWRELGEEIKIESQNISKPELVCFINDDSNDVSRVHFGIVWLLEIAEPRVSLKKEKGIGKLDFVDMSGLQHRRGQFEKWSQLLIDYFSIERDEVIH